MNTTAIIIHADDTVACVLQDHRAGETVTIKDGSKVLLKNDIPMGHKIALCSIPKGKPVVKFGAVIGYATAPISFGEHVHLHNLEGLLR